MSLNEWSYITFYGWPQLIDVYLKERDLMCDKIFMIMVKEEDEERERKRHC